MKAVDSLDDSKLDAPLYSLTCVLQLSCVDPASCDTSGEFVEVGSTFGTFFQESTHILLLLLYTLSNK